MSPLEISHSSEATLTQVTSSTRRREEPVGSCAFDCTAYMVPSSLTCLASSIGGVAAAAFHAPAVAIAGLVGMGAACTGAVCLQGFQAGAARARGSLGDAADDVGGEVKRFELSLEGFKDTTSELSLEIRRLGVHEEKLQEIMDLFMQVFSRYRTFFEEENKETRESVEKLRQKEEEIKKLIMELQEVNERNEEFKGRIIDLEVQVEKAKKLEKSIRSSKSFIAELKTEVTAQNKIIEDSEERVKKIQALLDEEVKQKSTLEVRLREVIAELDRSRLQIEASLGASFTTLQTAVESFIEIKADLETSLGDLEEEKLAWNRIEEGLREEAEELKTQAHLLQEQLKKGGGEISEDLIAIVKLLDSLKDRDLSFIIGYAEASEKVRAGIRESYLKEDGSLKMDEFILAESL